MDEQTKRELEAIERYSVPGNFWMHSTGVQQKRSVEDAWAEVRAAEARCRAAVEKLEKAVEEHRGRGTAPAADAEKAARMAVAEKSPFERVASEIAAAFDGGFTTDFARVDGAGGPEQEEVVVGPLPPSPLKVSDLPETPTLRKAKDDIIAAFGVGVTK